MLAISIKSFASAVSHGHLLFICFGRNVDVANPVPVAASSAHLGG
jgi:hypothetical protein